MISGRMNASIRFLVWDTIPLCGLLGGALGEIPNLRATLLVAVVGGVLAPGGCWPHHCAGCVTYRSADRYLLRCSNRDRSRRRNGSPAGRAEQRG